MALFKRFYNFIVNADLDAYMFDVEHYASMTDYVHGCGIIFKYKADIYNLFILCLYLKVFIILLLMLI